jgi:Mn-dependent DtxR family transcriptional regulator
MSASVTVTQCFNRLVDKGLVEREYGHGIKLTGSGIKQAKALVKQTKQ